MFVFVIITQKNILNLKVYFFLSDGRRGLISLFKDGGRSENLRGLGVTKPSKSAIMAIFHFWQNGTFEPLHEIEFLFFHGHSFGAL